MRILTGYMPPQLAKPQWLVLMSLTNRSKYVAGWVCTRDRTALSDMTVFDYLKFMADLRRVPTPKNGWMNC